MADRVGTQIGNYKLVRLLGSGGVSDVYLAEHLLLGRTAAVKILNVPLPEDGLRAFNTEARTIARLQHPNIIHLLDFGALEDKKYGEPIPYLVMDYAPNGSLRSLYPRGTSLPLETVIGYVRQVAPALQYMHDQKLLHLDVKPANMLIGLNKEILLSEPDIAFTSLSVRTQTVRQEVTGTPYYMAPEQFSARPVPASDQYALGIVVYEWLSGNLPFRGNTFEMFTQHLYTKPPSLREKVPVISSAVEDVVMRALAKKPEDRFPRVIDFALALERAAGAGSRFALPLDYSQQTLAETLRPSSTPPASPTPTVSSPQPSAYPSNPYNPPSYPAAGQYGPPPYPPPTTYGSSPYQSANPYSPYQAPPPAAITPPPFPGAVPTPLASPALSRRTILIGGIVGLLGLAGAEMLAHGALFQQRITTSSPTAGPATTGTSILVYTGHSNSVVDIAWSPDGNLIASASKDGTVQIWRGLTGAVSNLFHLNVTQLAWSPDGQSLALLRTDGKIQILDHGTLKTTPSSSYYATCIAWSPDSTKIVAGTYDGTLVTITMKESISVPVQGGPVGEKVVAWSPDGNFIALLNNNDTLSIVDVATQVAATNSNVSPFTSLSWSPDSKALALGGNSGSVLATKTTKGSMTITSQLYSGMVLTVVWAPNGKYIALASPDHLVKIISVLDKKMIFSYSGHTDAVTSVAWSPDSHYVASGSLDHTVRVWKVG